MSKEEMKYEKAVSELEEIVDKMERDELDIDQLSEQLKRAKVLVKLCKDKLTKTDEEIKKLLSEIAVFCMKVRAPREFQRFVRSEEFSSKGIPNVPAMVV